MCGGRGGRGRGRGRGRGLRATSTGGSDRRSGALAYFHLVHTIPRVLPPCTYTVCTARRWRAGSPRTAATRRARRARCRAAPSHPTWRGAALTCARSTCVEPECRSRAAHTCGVGPLARTAHGGTTRTCTHMHTHTHTHTHTHMHHVACACVPQALRNLIEAWLREQRPPPPPAAPPAVAAPAAAPRRAARSPARRRR